MARLSIYLLGPLRVFLEGQPVAGFESDKVRALLAYLAAEPGRPHRREALAGLLWPDRSEKSARACLRSALTNLRQVIDEPHAVTPCLIISPNHILQPGKRRLGRRKGFIRTTGSKGCCRESCRTAGESGRDLPGQVPGGVFRSLQLRL